MLNEPSRPRARSVTGSVPPLFSSVGSVGSASGRSRDCRAVASALLRRCQRPSSLAARAASWPRDPCRAVTPGPASPVTPPTTSANINNPPVTRARPPPILRPLPHLPAIGISSSHRRLIVLARSTCRYSRLRRVDPRNQTSKPAPPCRASLPSVSCIVPASGFFYRRIHQQRIPHFIPPVFKLFRLCSSFLRVLLISP